MTHASPLIRQIGYAGRCDNDSESAATWKYADGTCGDTAANALNRDWDQTVDENFRVRFLLEEYNGQALTAVGWQIKRRLNSGAWVNVTASSSIVKAVGSIYLTDKEDTTQQIGSGSFFNILNGCVDDNDGANEDEDANFGANEEGECEFCVQIIGDDVSDGDTIEFKPVWYATGNDVQSYNAYATVTVDKPATPITVQPTKVDLTASPKDVAVYVDPLVQPSKVDLTIIPQNVSVYVDPLVQPSKVDLTVSLPDPAAYVDPLVQPSKVDLTISPQNVAVYVDPWVRPDKLDLTLSINDVTVVQAGAAQIIYPNKVDLALSIEDIIVNPYVHLDKTDLSITVFGPTVTVATPFTEPSMPAPPPAFWQDPITHRKAIVDYLVAVADRAVPWWYNNNTRPSATTNPGKVIYNTDTGKMQYSNGTSWVDL